MSKASRSSQSSSQARSSRLGEVLAEATSWRQRATAPLASSAASTEGRGGCGASVSACTSASSSARAAAHVGASEGSPEPWSLPNRTSRAQRAACGGGRLEYMPEVAAAAAAAAAAVVGAAWCAFSSQRCERSRPCS